MDDAAATTPVGTRRLRGAWRRTAAGLAAGCSLLCSAACGAEPQPAAWGVITIGGATYRLPAAVFDGGEAYQGRQDSMLLELPLLAGPDDPTAEPVRVLLNEIKDRNEIARQHHIQRSIALNASVAVSLDPHRHNQPLTPAAQRAPDAPAGLVQVAIDKSDSLGEDVFVRPPLSHVTEFIKCSRLGGAIHYPSCSQYFASTGMTVEASYDRVELAKWDRIRQSVLAYLQRCKVK